MGKSQEEIAEMVGVDQSRIARWERGDSFPEPLFREKLAEKMGLTDDDFDISESLLTSDLIPGFQEMIVSFASLSDNLKPRLFGYADNLVALDKPQAVPKPKRG